MNLIDLFSKVSENNIVGIFGKTGHGKTTLCKLLTHEALTLTENFYVYYIDTEGGARDLLRIAENEHSKSRIKYIEASTSDQVTKALAKLVRNPQSDTLLIIDSISMPSMVKWARSGRWDERLITVLDQVNLVSKIREIANEYGKRKLTLIPVTVLHPVSEMTVTREIQKIIYKISEVTGEKKIKPESIPEEIEIMCHRPTGGKSLHLIKEVWISIKMYTGRLGTLTTKMLMNLDEEQFITKKIGEVLEKLSKQKRKEETLEIPIDDIKVTKFSVRAWRSRVFADAEPLVNIYILNMPNMKTPIYTYRVLVEDEKLEIGRGIIVV